MLIVQKKFPTFPRDNGSAREISILRVVFCAFSSRNSLESRKFSCQDSTAFRSGVFQGRAIDLARRKGPFCKVQS